MCCSRACVDSVDTVWFDCDAIIVLVVSKCRSVLTDGIGVCTGSVQCADLSKILSQYRQDRSGGLVDAFR